MPNQLPTDQSFSKMMKKSKLVMPFSDFEERTMARIHKESIVKNAVSKYKRLAVLFFILGTGVGFVLTYFLSLPETNNIGISSDTLLLICRLGYVFLVLTQLNYILKLFSKSGNYRFP
jgi:predicted RND superfamily exporter protein